MSESLWSNTSPVEPLTTEAFERVYAEMRRLQGGQPQPIELVRILVPREQQIIAAFDGECIFPPFLHEVMMRHGVHKDAPAWSQEEFELLWKELQEAWAKENP